MKKPMTVYDLISALAQYPADKFVEFYVWATKDQIKTYVEDVTDDDYVKFTAWEIDADSDIHYNDPSARNSYHCKVIIEMDVDDL